MDANKKTRIIDVSITAVALLGAGFMAYLTSLHFSGADSSICDFGEGFSCDIVNKSAYSELLGIPLSVLGIVYFLTIAALVWIQKKAPKYLYVLMFSVFSLVFGLYLSGIEYRVLYSICLFCELSKVLMVVLIVLAGFGARHSKEKSPVSMLVAAAIVGLLFSGGAYLLQRDPVSLTDSGPDHSAVAECLTAKGVSMYSAFWCPSCAKQKKYFGAAFGLIEEIECDPRGQGAEPERCIEKEIRKTPTWIWDENGVEIKRLEGAHQISDLAEYFDCVE